MVKHLVLAIRMELKQVQVICLLIYTVL